MNCKFGASLKERLKDKFVTGLKPGKVLDRVCEESHQTSFKDVLEIALKRESTIESTPTENLSMSVNKISIQARSNETKTEERNTGEGSKAASRSAVKCKHCGGFSHESSKCRYKHYKCNNCKVVGHLKSVCTKPQKENKSENKNRNNYVSENESEDESKYELYSINRSKNVNKLLPTVVEVKMSGKNVKME